MVRIAITGGIACGKSLVASFLAEEGVPVREADELAHELMAPGTPVFEEIVGEFGAGILGGDGSIDRALLGKNVFSDGERLARLNAITHPPIECAWEEWLSAHGAAGEAAAAVVVPLLYETGREKNWNFVICVSAYESLQLERLLARGLAEEDARKRMGAQGPITEKMASADYVVVNNGAVDAAGEQVIRILRDMLEK
ncbi:dephospho-CoA kinase [Verrucomicrobiota bacterium]